MLFSAAAAAGIIAYANLVTCSPSVQLNGTSVVGQSFPELEQEFFGGIPFAQPPLGNLRFAPPQLKLSPGGATFNATAFGPDCIQFGIDPASEGINDMSEDCLFINVFRPVGVNASSELPVMVWLYGGGFVFGGSSIYNGSAIVQQSIARGTPTIFASINYRLGPFGFPQGAEAESKGSLNLGLKGSLTALQWVQANIGAFGGDKDKVTIFGESAGAMTISELLLNPNFSLARAAIMESGSAASPFLFNATRRQTDWNLLVSFVPECANVPTTDSFECLRSASANTILNATNTMLSMIQERFPFSPNLDGPNGIIPDLPSKLYAQGHFSKMPRISGCNLDEGTALTSMAINSTQQIIEIFQSNFTPSAVPEPEFEADVAGILKLYPDVPALGSPYGTGNQTFGLSSQFKRASAIVGDTAFHSQRRSLSELLAANGVPNYAYLFTDPQTSLPPVLGVPHMSEIPYVFGDPLNGPSSVSLSKTMIDYWVSFANSLSPNDGKGDVSRITWTPYTSTSKDVIQLNNANLTMIPDTYRATQIGFIQANHLALRQ